MLLELNELIVECIIGDLPAERTHPQSLQVDLRLEIPERAAMTDELSDTVDYAALSERICAALVAAQCRMIERAAKVVADVCVREPIVRGVRVKITKRGAVPGLTSASAIYEVANPA